MHFPPLSPPGVISVAVLGGLDRETISSYSFQLTATDQGSARLAGIVPITVRVTDTNDNIPVFGLPQYTASVPEVSGEGGGGRGEEGITGDCLAELWCGCVRDNGAGY